MITIEVDTFKEAQIRLQALTIDVTDLTVKLHSDFDAPAHCSALPMIPELYEQLNYLASELHFNPRLNGLAHFTFKCRFTLNAWECFDPLVAALNSKPDSLSCHFVTSVAISENSFTYLIKNTSAEIAMWE
jgi:hypothetical protein